MRPKHLVTLLLVLLAVALPGTPVQAHTSSVSICDEAHLLQALAGGGTVTFTCSGTITLTATIKVTADTSIDGSGQKVTISGNHAVQVFSVNPGITLSLNAVTVADGDTAGNGGGALNEGSLIVSHSTFTCNASFWCGGAIENTGTLTVSNSTFSGNSAYCGSSIFNQDGTVTVSNSTFHETSNGLSNSNGTVTLQNTIVAQANSFGPANCGGTIIDGGGNLSYPDTTCPGINGDPELGPLQDNGGPTQTVALGPGSAAREAADDAICGAPPVNNLDQRGFTRPVSLHCDIGAYEYEHGAVPIPMAKILVGGPDEGSVGTSYAFTATVTPNTASLPITYIWQATGQVAVTHVVSGLSDTKNLTTNFTWSTPGDKTVTLTATNAAGTVTGSRDVHIVFPVYLKYLPVICQR